MVKYIGWVLIKYKYNHGKVIQHAELVLLGRFNPATVRGKIVNGQKVPYGPGENFANDPTPIPGRQQASTWKNPDALPTQAAKTSYWCKI